MSYLIGIRAFGASGYSGEVFVLLPPTGQFDAARAPGRTGSPIALRPRAGCVPVPAWVTRGYTAAGVRRVASGPRPWPRALGLGATTAGATLVAFSPTFSPVSPKAPTIKLKFMYGSCTPYIYSLFLLLHTYHKLAIYVSADREGMHPRNCRHPGFDFEPLDWNIAMIYLYLY